MSNFKIEKLKILLQKGAFYVLIISILGELVEKFLFILNLKNIENEYDYYLALLFNFIFIFLYKHRYWIISCILLFINNLVEIVEFGGLEPIKNTIKYEYYDTKMIVSVLGITLLLISLFYCIKFWRRKNYTDYFILKNF